MYKRDFLQPEILKYKEKSKVQMRYFIKLAYNGSLYHGWQTTERLVSSRNDEQGYFYLAQLRNQYHGAGRTDTGVHAGNVCPF
jgi:tRNA pseudouridine38-40 synthase